MAIITRQSLFSWDDVEIMPDIERIKLVLKYLPDEKFMMQLEKIRKNGRNDFPVRAMWNFVIIFLLTGHRSWSSHIRELNRNRDLASTCGFQS